MHFMLNGEPREMPDGTSVAELLGQLRLNRQRIAIEVNHEVLPRAAYDSRPIAPGDVIEIVHFIGGG